MGIDAMRITVHIKRCLVISIRMCYKTVCKHPFLVGFVCFLIFMYRSFPFLFSLLVSASPILVCTAILLGTLLSFGELNIPEIEKEKEAAREPEEEVEGEEENGEEEGVGGEEEDITRKISSLRAGIIRDATVIAEKDKKLFVESFVGNGPNTTEEAIGEWNEKRLGKIEKDDDMNDFAPLVDVNSLDIQFEKQVIGVEREWDLELEKTREIHKEKQGIEEVRAAESHYSRIQNGENESLQAADDKSPAASTATEHDDQLEQHSSWKRANGNEEEEDEDASDSGSDGAESSSPDASMADIIPMLDELHPLLHEGDPQPAHISDAGSEQLTRDKGSSAESDEETENDADGEEDGDDDNDNEEEEEEEDAQGGKEDEYKSAIKWTEDDQKNLMDLGTSELERNLRLESLIARRRARKSTRLITERNLIDLDGADLPMNIAPISTARRNPFDLPFDSFDDVPGSAPSILLPRHNPFDLPYDSNEEKPDLKGDSFQEEFSAVQRKEPFFRRHESFNVGSSVLGAAKHERQDLRWKPYFIPERFATDESSYRTFHRQLSEASESKLSSVLDTESVSSAVDEEEKKLNDEDCSQEAEMLSTSVDHASLLVQCGSLSSEDVDSLDIGTSEVRDPQHVDEEIALGNVENHHELDSSLSTSGLATPVELNTNEILLRMEPGEEEYSSRSSRSSFSEIDERIPNVTESLSLELCSGQTDESHVSMQSSLDSVLHSMTGVADAHQHKELVLELRGDSTTESVMQTSFDLDLHVTNGAKESNIHMEPKGDHTGHPETSLQASIDSDSHFMSDSVDNNQHKEPVYDLSPQASEKLLSFLPVSSDTEGERSEVNSPPELDKFAGKESEVHDASVENDASGYEELHEGSLQDCSMEENEPRSREVTESELEVTKAGQAGVDLTFNGQNSQNGFEKLEMRTEHDEIDLPPSSGNGSIKEYLLHEEKGFHDEHDQVRMASVSPETIVVTNQDAIQKSDSAFSSSKVASAETVLHAGEEQHHSVAVDASADPYISISEPASSEERSLDAEGIHHLKASGTVQEHGLRLSATEEQRPAVVAEREASLDLSSSEINNVDDLSSQTQDMLISSSNSESIIASDLPEDGDIKLVSSEPKIPLKLEKQLSWSDKAVVEKSLDELKGPSIIPAEVQFENNADEHETSELASVPQENLENKSKAVAEAHRFSDIEENINEVEDEMKEIDEGLLSELDTVGDFRVTEVIEGQFHDEQIQGHNHYLSPRGSSAAEMGSELPALEVRSVTDAQDVTFQSMVPDHLAANESRIPKEADLDSQAFEGNSFKDIHVATQQASESNTGELQKQSDLMEELAKANEMGSSSSNRELPVLEIRTINDIDLAFKQLTEGVDVEEVILPSTIEQPPIENKLGDDSGFDLPVVEARSLEDLHIAMKQASEVDVVEMPKPDTDDGPVELDVVGSSRSIEELPVLEVRTADDIALAFKQLREGADVGEVILPSMLEQHVELKESSDPQESSSDLPVVEARSLEELHVAMKQVPGANTEEPRESSGSIKETVSTSEMNEMGRDKDIESSNEETPEVVSTQKSGSPEESVVKETGSDAPQLPKDGVH